jgi:hypothetical protein
MGAGPLTQIAGRGTTDVDLTSAPLRDVENYIAPRLRGFVEAGIALLAIKDRRLYLQGGWDTFEIYTKQRWGIDDSHARRMVDAAQVAQITASANVPMGASVENERQARELAPLLGRPDELKATWEEAVTRTGGVVTAQAIRTIRRDRERRAAPAPEPLLPRPPAPEPAVPANVHRTFLLVSQAMEEVRALGAPGIFRGLPVAPDVLGIWAGKFEDAAALCAELAQACRGTGVD